MRIAVLSDIHANLPALEAVLAALGPVDAVWHLGDVVGYGPHPDEVVARLGAIGAVGVRGNHDGAAVDGSGIDHFNPAARAAIEWTAARIEPRTRAWLAELPDLLVLDGATLVHGSLLDPTWEYLLSPAAARASLGALTTPLLLHGHTHRPAAWWTDGGEVVGSRTLAGDERPLDEGRQLLNPGSVGQPRDGDPRASAMIIDTDRRRAAWLRVAYPIAAVQADIRAAGLPDWLAQRLERGQ